MSSQGGQRQPGASRAPAQGAGFLSQLPAELREDLSRGASRVVYERGARIDDAGSAPRPGIVQEGLIRGYVVAEDGREATIRYMRPGDAVAIAGPLMEGWPCSLQALESTTVLYFDQRQFEAALTTEVALAHRVAESLVRTLESYAHALRVLAFGRVRQRVAEHLISLAGHDGHGRLVARVTQQGLADAVGSVRDVVARSLSDFSESGLVGTSHGSVEILDEEALRQEAVIK